MAANNGVTSADVRHCSAVPGGSSVVRRAPSTLVGDSAGRGRRRSVRTRVGVTVAGSGRTPKRGATMGIRTIAALGLLDVSWERRAAAGART